jgi:hypothetical protein
MRKSKPLNHADTSGFDFVKEMLCGDLNGGTDGFDRVMKHPKYGYIFFELLRVKEHQSEIGITPYTSHPNKYWNTAYRKFLSQWNLYKSVNTKARYYLVNYAPKGEKFEDEVKLMRVKHLDINKGLATEDHLLTRNQFSKWLRKINAECIEANI